MSLAQRVLCVVGNSSGPVRRSLFGPLDRDQLQAEYRDALHRDVQEASRRWGFDFLSDRPLQGAEFQWEGLPGARVPVLYRPCTVGAEKRPRGAEKRPRGEGLRPRGAETKPKGEESTSAVAMTTSSARQVMVMDKENLPRTPKKNSRVQQNLERTPDKSQSLKRKQTNITDFYQAKRRVVATARKSGQ